MIRLGKLRPNYKEQLSEDESQNTYIGKLELAKDSNELYCELENGYQIPIIKAMGARIHNYNFSIASFAFKTNFGNINPDSIVLIK